MTRPCRRRERERQISFSTNLSNRLIFFEGDSGCASLSGILIPSREEKISSSISFLEVICLDVKNSSLKVAIQMSREFKLSFRIGVSK